jgi:hypothetical protein
MGWPKGVKSRPLESILKRKQYLTIFVHRGTVLEKVLTAIKGKGTSDEANYRHHQAVPVG